MSGSSPGTLLQRAGLWRSLRRDRIVSSFEFWPGWLFHAPIVLQWIALGLRHGGMTLPTCANPHIETGGLCGESKIAILDLIQPEARHWLAPYTSFVTGATSEGDLELAEAARVAAGLDWPLVVKPDIGCTGCGVRLVADAPALARYLAEFPRNARVMLQEYIHHEAEAGIFYIRRPGEVQGRITSVTLKSSPVVIGNGRSTLRQLILDDPRAGLVPHLYLPRLKDRLHEVPAAGERVRLVFVGNHCRGATFRNGQHEITPALTACIDRIAHAIPDFHFGRFDLRFASIPGLRDGKDFRIIEINGVGSEATHIWDPNTTLREAYAVQFAHYRAAFEVGRANRARGHRPTGLLELLEAWRRQRRLLASYPLND
jgi:hypothetical protein